MKQFKKRLLCVGEDFGVGQELVDGVDEDGLGVRQLLRHLRRALVQRHRVDVGHVGVTLHRLVAERLRRLRALQHRRLLWRDEHHLVEGMIQPILHFAPGFKSAYLLRSFLEAR